MMPNVPRFEPSSAAGKSRPSLALHWIANLSTSSLHAADSCLMGRALADPAVAVAIPGPATALHHEIARASLPSRLFWRNLLALAHQFENNRELATMAIRKTVRWEPRCEISAAAIGDQIGTLEAAIRNACPNLIDELDLRSRPLREQWEARGPGLLRQIGKLTEERLVPDQAVVVLVHPALGGGGAAHLLNNSVRIEAVLTNRFPQLPEVVRLGWLLAQLHCDLPAFSESLPADRLPLLAQLALLPPTLQAAQELELAEFHRENILTAIAAWHLEVPAESVAESLLVWWQTYQDSQPAWATALAALDRLVANLPQ